MRTNVKKFRNKIVTTITPKEVVGQNVVGQNVVGQNVIGPITLYDIKKGDKVKAVLELDNLWINNGTYGINWNIKEIII